MTFNQAIKTCLYEKIFTISGRASRSEYWYFYLLLFIISVIASTIFLLFLDEYNFAEEDVLSTVLYLTVVGPLVMLDLISILFIIPRVCVSARRLHDIGKSGWWQLIGYIPIIGQLIMLFFYIKKGTAESNRFGPSVI